MVSWYFKYRLSDFANSYSLRHLQKSIFYHLLWANKGKVCFQSLICNFYCLFHYFLPFFGYLGLREVKALYEGTTPSTRMV